MRDGVDMVESHLNAIITYCFRELGNTASCSLEVLSSWPDTFSSIPGGVVYGVASRVLDSSPVSSPSLDNLDTVWDFTILELLAPSVCHGGVR